MTKKRNLTEAAEAATAGLFSGIKKPLNDTERAILEKYNSGMTKQADISEDTGKDKATVSRALKRIKEDYPELLQEQPQKAAEEPKKPEPMESKPELKKPQKAKKEVFSFRAELSDKERWKAYATATGQTMESIGTAAMNEYLRNHALSENQKIIFEALTVEAKQ